MMGIDLDREFRPVRIVLLKVRDNTTRTDDAAGDLLASLAREAGHRVVARERVGADVDVLAARLRAWVDDPAADVVITIGGTGLGPLDVAPAALANVWELEVPGFGELFRRLSFDTVGTSAISSRACAGVANSTCLFALPGSPGGVRDAWDGILADQLDSRHRPCNMTQLMVCAGPVYQASALK